MPHPQPLTPSLSRSPRSQRFGIRAQIRSVVEQRGEECSSKRFNVAIRSRTMTQADCVARLKRRPDVVARVAAVTRTLRFTLAFSHAAMMRSPTAYCLAANGSQFVVTGRDER